MKQAPAFGAIPSTKDLEKKKQEEEELADNADAILVKLCSKDARERLNFTESEEPAVADQVKDQLMETRAYWMLNGPVSDDKMKGMIDAIHAAKVRRQTMQPAASHTASCHPSTCRFRSLRLRQAARVIWLRKSWTHVVWCSIVDGWPRTRTTATSVSPVCRA